MNRRNFLKLGTLLGVLSLTPLVAKQNNNKIIVKAPPINPQCRSQRVAIV